MLGQLPGICGGLLSQYRFAGLDDGQDMLLASGLDEMLDIAVEFEVDLAVLAEHRAPFRFG